MRILLIASKAPLVFGLVLMSVASSLLIPACQNGLAAMGETNEESQRVTSLAERDKLTQLQMNEAYGKLPFSFEANNGQCDPRVKFLSRAGDHTLFLTSTYAVLRLGGPAQLTPAERELPQVQPDEQRLAVAKSNPCVLRMKLIGANPAAKVAGLDELPGKSNYFIGNDPKKWRAGISNYARVQY